MNIDQITFTLASIVAFAIPTVIFWIQYGYLFLYETYLYHFGRHDHRHNFSIISTWSTLTAPRGIVEGEMPLHHTLAAASYIPVILKVAQVGDSGEIITFAGCFDYRVAVTRYTQFSRTSHVYRNICICDSELGGYRPGESERTID